MCAICGIFDVSGKPVQTVILDSMLRVQEHRGPDGSGTFIEGKIGLGHRRLSIIDLGGGAQPISNEDDSLQIVFNGEIYNFVELRKELEGLGHLFKTHSDTEVIIHAYEQWGIDSLKRLNGMFAFALWDRTRDELFIARDHLGIKPLYYMRSGNQFLFASELKALLQHPDCRREVDVNALAELFTFRYVPSPKTLLTGIYKLPPGHSIRVSGQSQEIKRFWTWVPQVRTKWNEADLISEYQALLEDAIRIQLRSDVPLGLFLSSGVDSGVLLAVMSKYASGPVKTFTIGFEDGEKMNEVSDAAVMAQRFGADHQAQMVSAADYATYFERYMSDLEEPVGHESAAAFYFVSKLAREKVKVALTGQGADEPWAGYDRYIGVKLSGLYAKMPRLLTQQLAPMVARFPGRMERFKRGVASLSEPDTLTRFTKVYSFFSADMKAQLYKNGLREGFLLDAFGTKEALRRLQSDVQHLDPLTQMLYIDSRASLPDDLLMVGDKTSMANSLEVRVPFLDYRLVEFIESLPSHLKLNGFTGKYLHKKAMTKWLPRDVVYRKKKGFSIPLGHWLRTSLKDFVDEALLSPDAHIAKYFDQNYIRTVLERDRAGTDQFTRHIYLLLSLELWHRTIFSQPSSAVPNFR
jgi:asparagine synthase (glutamine-hydrolysing)